MAETPLAPVPHSPVDGWEDVVEALGDGLSVVAPSGRVLFVSGRSVELNGFEREEVVGRYVQDLLRAGFADRSPSMEVIRTRTAVTTVQTIRDGRKLLVSATPVFTIEGGLRYVVVTQRDITELHRLMSRLDESMKLSERYRSELRLIEMREAQRDRLVARSSTMQSVQELALRCSAVDSTVLILGETGTGKSMVAKLIHHASPRSAGPFIQVNCGAIPEGLIESELFGYLRGAFTGADPRGKTGLVELADRGTLLLDEIGELPLSVQVKLLRFLEDGEVQAIGGVRPRRVNVRVVSATNRDLRDMVRQGAFRQDLFYRLNVLTIQVPPLRQHREDIPWLIDMMLERLAERLKRRRKLSPRALELVTQYAFPGNVRELWNLTERLVVTSDGDTIDVADLLKDAMQRCGSQALAARYLGIGQATVSRKLRQHGLKG